MRRWLRSHQRAVEVVLFLALLLAGFGILRSAGASQRFTIDESRWISTSRYFWITFVEGDLFGSAWQPNYLVLTQPPVARYLFGFGLWLQGWQPDQLNGRYDSLRSRAYNEEAGNIPSPELLAASRRVSLTLAMLAVILLYLVGRSLAGPVAGFAAAALALANPLLTTLWTRALAEAALACFTLGAVWCGILLAARRERAAAEAGLGVTLGLAAATKLSGALFAVGLAAYGLIAAAIRSAASRRLSLPGPIVGAGAVAAIVFTLVNPLLYPNPVGRTVMMFEHRRDEMQQQRRNFPSQAVPEGILPRAQLVLQSVFGEYRSLPGPADAGLVVVGLVLLGRRARREVASSAPAPAILVLCITAALYGGMTPNLGFDSSHYYAPPLTLNVIIEGVGAATIAGLLVGGAQKIQRPLRNNGSRTSQTATTAASPTQTSGRLPS